MRLCGPFALSARRPPSNSGHRRTASRARASAPPSSRSITQTAVAHRSPASRRASTASSRSPARGHHVLDEAHALALLERAFEAVVGAVAFAGLAHDQEGQPGGERARPPRARRRRARARRGAPRPARTRRPWPRSARRAPRAGQGASRSGTCRGSSANGGRSGARSRPRDRRARGSRRGARRRSSPGAGGCSDVVGERKQPLAPRASRRQRESSEPSS